MKEILIFLLFLSIVSYGLLTIGATIYLSSEISQCFDIFMKDYDYYINKINDTNNKEYYECKRSLEESNAQKLMDFNDNLLDKFWGRK